MTRPGPDGPSFTVLLVCTGNICRSALAERLGRAFLDERLGDAAGEINLVSAGTRAVVDSAMHPDSSLVLQGYGAHPGDFRARQLTDGMPAEADLILTMTRAHRSEVLRLAPRALQRTFTVREAADLLQLTEPAAQSSSGTPAERARQLVQELAAARARRQSGSDDDVQDPIGKPLEVHQDVGEVIVAALLPVLGRIADLFADPVPSAPGREDGRRALPDPPSVRARRGEPGPGAA